MACKGIARISAAALLALALLAGLLPSGVLSAAKACRMACCAGKPLHEAGACNAVLPVAAPTDAAPEETNTAEHAAHHDGMEMSVTVTVDETVTETTATETTASSGHCQTTKHSSAERTAAAHPSTVRPAQLERTTVAAYAFTKPCSEECAAAAGAFMQVRRPREAAAHSIAGRPRPPTLVSRVHLLDSLLLSSTARRRQSSPRAPPVSLLQLPA